MDDALSLKAMHLAHHLHHKQKHGIGPYFLHLAHVVNVLLDFDYGSDEEMIAAAWLHDAVEDQGLTQDYLREHFSIRTADLVWAVSGFGENRAARNADIKAKIDAYPEAAILKVADRIANVEASPAGSRFRTMYLRESPAFILDVARKAPARMVERLMDALMEGMGQVA